MVELMTVDGLDGTMTQQLVLMYEMTKHLAHHMLLK
jgi:hypothetical protein